MKMTRRLKMTLINTLFTKRVDLFDLIFLLQGLNHELEQVPGEILTFSILHWIQNMWDNWPQEWWWSWEILRKYQNSQNVSHASCRNSSFFLGWTIEKVSPLVVQVGWWVCWPKCKLIGSDAYCNVAKGQELESFEGGSQAAINLGLLTNENYW